MHISTVDLGFMTNALSLSLRSLGNSSPNPCVGCIVVNNNNIVGTGWTQPGGRPHAETQALKEAGHLSINSDIYITLEPCSHHGKTSPCVDKIIQAKPKRVIIGSIDPDPRVNGKGIQKLKKNGIDVLVGVLEKNVQEINEGFFSRLKLNRPFFSVKIACSADGKISLSNGKSKWITGDKSRNYSHILRALYDGIMIGSETALKDNPKLNCRLNGIEDYFNPVKIVIDRRLRLERSSNIASQAKNIKTYIFTSNKCDIKKKKNLEDLGVNVKSFDFKNETDFNKQFISYLSSIGINRILVEGGAYLITNLFKLDFVDKLYLFRSPILLGNDSKSFLSDLNFNHLSEVIKMRKSETITFDDDTLDIYTRN